MKRTLKIDKTEPLIGLAGNIVYMQKPYWCNASAYQLSMSFMGPRQYFPYDGRVQSPLIVFFCGGGYMKQDRNVWMAELAWFAKRGYAVACVDYSTLPQTRWPEQIVEAKTAIRFLRAHAAQFHIIPDKIAVMGESAGGYLSSMLAVTSGGGQYDEGAWMDQSSAVQCAVPWYPPARVAQRAKDGHIRVETADFPDPAALATAQTPPFLILHGTADDQVPHSEGEYLHDALNAAGAQADLLLVEGANHADIHFVQDGVKELVLEFLDKHLK